MSDYKVEYIEFDTPKEEVNRLVKEHGLEKSWIKLVQADYRTMMIISGEGILPSSYTDGGEPEDNSFSRDWSWIKTELERAYELGRSHAYAEVKLYSGV